MESERFIRVVSADWHNSTDIEDADGMLVNSNGGLSVFRDSDLLVKFAEGTWSGCHAMERTLRDGQPALVRHRGSVLPSPDVPKRSAGLRR